MIMNITKQFIKSAAYWLVPNGFYELAKKMMGIIEVCSMPFLKKNAKFKDIHKGDRCFILCTGPSINKQNLLPLKDEITFGVSNFYYHKDYSLIKPKYHCVPVISSIFSEDDIIRWFTEMNARTGDAEIFLHVNQKPIVEKNGLFPSRKINYLNMTAGLDIKEANINITGKMPGVQSIPIMCLMIALYMGFKEIYLLGTEHDSYKTNKYEYFFKGQLTVGKDPSVDKDRRIADSEYISLLSNLNLWTQYRALKQIAEARGISIYNATEGGILDEFKRVSLESLF